MSAARLIIVGVLVQAVVLALAVTVSLLIGYRLISQRESVWCPLLASIHAPAHPDPAQERGFAQVTQVRRGLGCR